MCDGNGKGFWLSLLLRHSRFSSVSGAWCKLVVVIKYVCACAAVICRFMSRTTATVYSLTGSLNKVTARCWWCHKASGSSGTFGERHVDARSLMPLLALQVVVAVAGIMLFREPTSFQNLLSISMGLAAGIVFVLAKQGNK